MPGLYGLIRPGLPDLPDRLERMATAIRAGRETAHDQWADPAAGVGLGRESLGVFNPELQPVSNRERTIFVLFDGHLVDSAGVRRELGAGPGAVLTDADLALALYERDGAAGFARLHGIFAIAVWDARRQALVLANDRFGLRPLYLARDGAGLAFASEIRPLLEAGLADHTVDDHGLADFLTYGHVMGTNTLLAGVKLLPPAALLTWRAGEVATQTYWSLEYGPEAAAQPDEAWAEELAFRLARAVERRISRCCTLGLPLSGGYDSRMLLGVATELVGAHLPTYTYGRPGSRDGRRAAWLARAAGVSHRFLELPADYLPRYALEVVRRCDGMLNCVESHAVTLQQIADECQVVMLGNGGDSFFYSYRGFHREALKLEGDPAENLYQATSNPFKEHELRAVLDPALYRRLEGLAPQHMREAVAALRPNSYDNLYDAIDQREVHRRGVLHGLYTINNSLEYVEPFYDYDVVDLALALPERLRWQRALYLQVMEQTAPVLAAYEGGPLEPKPARAGLLQRGVRRLSRALGRGGAAGRREHSFADLGELLRGENRRWVESILFSSETQARGWLQPQAVQALLGSDPPTPAAARKLGALITIELWLREFQVSL